MGIWKNVRLAREVMRASGTVIPHWGRIVRVGGKAGPLVYVYVEVHLGTAPPHEEKILTSPPRGVRPQVGQDVFVSTAHSDRHTVYVIDWNRPPQYGPDRAPAGTAETPDDIAAGPVSQIQRLNEELAAGRITREEYLRAWQASMRGDQGQ